MKILVLDDDPQRHAAFATQAKGHDIDHVWLVDDAIEKVNRTRYDLVCLDNDLDTESYVREGYEVADHIALMAQAKRPASVLVHSWNSVRARQMMSALRPFYGPRSLIYSEFGEFALLAPGECEGNDVAGWIKPADLRDVLDAIPRAVLWGWLAEEKRVGGSLYDSWGRGVVLDAD